MKWEGEFPPAPPANKKFDYDSLAEIRRIHREFEVRKWAAPIYWLEALPRARWWLWLRENIAMIVSSLLLVGSLWGSWYLWKWFIRALLAE